MANSIFKALAHPDRRKIMALLKSGPMLAGDLADSFSSSWPTISRHLAVLKEADLITAERQGNAILYRANASVLEDAASALLSLAGITQQNNKEDLS
jgi:DNA-binding transcriptional ArsR family regulator